MAERENEFVAFLVGFIVGGVVGGIAALLLAPQSGEETRTLIHDRSIELKDKAVEKAETARIKAEAAAAEARARADELIKMTQEKAAEYSKKGSAGQNKDQPASGDNSEVTVEG